MSDPDADLAETAAELEQSMRDLRRELESDLPRGPLGLPRPPSPGELLRFADEAVIPALIAILEANIKILESIQYAIRLANSGRRATEETKHRAETVRTLGEDTLNQFEAALDDLQSVIEDGGLPEDDEAREILEEARRLREDLSTEVDKPDDKSDSADDADEDSEETEMPEGLDIDIDSELESIKQEYENQDSDDEGSDLKGES